MLSGVWRACKKQIVARAWSRCLGVAAFACAGLVGCTTQEHRARQYSRYFEALAPAKQERLARGQIGLGDRPEDVYVALGAPAHTYPIETVAGKEGWRWEYLGERLPDDDPYDELTTLTTQNDFAITGRGERLVRIEFFGGAVTGVYVREVPAGFHFNSPDQRMSLPEMPGRSPAP